MCAKEHLPDIAERLEDFLANSNDTEDDQNMLLETDNNRKHYIVEIPVELIQPGQSQSRISPEKDEYAVAGLARSIDCVGIIQPLIVEPAEDGHFRILCGHRRWLAARNLGKPTVPCIVNRKVDSDENRILIALIENLQRRDMSPIELSDGYARLKEMGLSQKAIAEKVGKSKHHVNKALAFRDRLTDEEWAKLQKVESIQPLEFVRLEMGSQIQDPELRHMCLFESIALNEVKRIKKQQDSPQVASGPKKISYSAEYKNGGLRASIKLTGRPLTRPEVFEVSRKLGEKICEEYHLEEGNNER